MSESSDELKRKIDELAARAGQAQGFSSEAGFEESSLVHQGEGVAWEALTLLKRRSQSRLKHWAGLVEQKEKALESSRLRESELESELGFLRQRLEERRGEDIEEALSRQTQMEAALKALNEERARHEGEKRALKALLDETRRRLAEAAANYKREEEEWVRREQAHLTDLKELEGIAERHRQEVDHSGEESRRLARGLEDAKGALEKTLAELLEERRIRQEAEKERSSAIKKVEEIQGHLSNLEKIWDEERAQWKELWQRERSGWENQKAEFSAWEQKLRRERENWHEEMRSKEEAELKFASDLAQTLRNSAEASSKIGALARRFGGMASGSGESAAARKIRSGLKVIAAAAVLAGAAYASFLYMTTPRFRSLQAAPVSWNNPTSLAFDGSLLWAAQWDGTLAAVDPQNLGKAVETVAVGAPSPYRPVALAFGGNFLWSLDAAQGRLLRQDAQNPGRVIGSVSSPGPAPTALAYDGKSIWSYDAATKAVYRHGDPESGFETFAFPTDLVPSAMAWVGGDLWVSDSKTHEIAALSMKDRAFVVKARYSFDENVIGLAPVAALGGKARRRLWVLAGPNGRRAGNALIEYSY